MHTSYVVCASSVWMCLVSGCAVFIQLGGLLFLNESDHLISRTVVLVANSSSRALRLGSLCKPTHKRHLWERCLNGALQILYLIDWLTSQDQLLILSLQLAPGSTLYALNPVPLSLPLASTSFPSHCCLTTGKYLPWFCCHGKPIWGGKNVPKRKETHTHTQSITGPFFWGYSRLGQYLKVNCLELL